MRQSVQYYYSSRVFRHLLIIHAKRVPISREICTYTQQKKHPRKKRKERKTKFEFVQGFDTHSTIKSALIDQYLVNKTHKRIQLYRLLLEKNRN